MGTAPSLRNAQWRKSTYSGSNGGDCLEVAYNHPAPVIPVRDSKNPTGPVLLIGGAAWQAFVDGLR